MRKILLAGAAMLATTGMAMAAGSATVTLESTVPNVCTIGSTIAPVVFGEGDTSKVGSFTTNCNFSLANISVSFKSANGGLLNAAEEVKAPYNLTYSGVTKAAADITDSTLFIAEPAGTPRNSPKTRNFTVALSGALTVGGTYSDTLTINVTP